MKPIVLVDADVLGRQRTGDESYVENVLRELGARDDAGMRIAAVTRDPSLIPSGIEAVSLSTRSQIRRMLFGLPAIVRRLQPALVHYQYIAPPRSAAPVAVTVHDLSFEDQPRFFSLPDLLAFRMLVPRSVRGAAVVFTVSEWTRKRIADRYGVPAGRIVVTPNGVDEIFRPEGERLSGAPPFILFVGAIQPRKDPTTAVEALAGLDKDLHLVFAGPSKRGATDLRRLVERLGLTERVSFRGYVGKNELAVLYRSAECLIFPSRYEGFGLPVLEAMASGTPVVASRATSIPEIAGDAAELVEPGRPDAFADGVRRALSQRTRLSEAGLVRAGLYTWAETAKRTLAAYREVVGP